MNSDHQTEKSSPASSRTEDNQARKRQTIIITGANGFIGSRLCEVFANQGWTVYGGVRLPENSILKDRPDVELFQWDIPERMDWPDVPADVCLHAAWTMKAKDLTGSSPTNIMGTKTAFRNAVLRNLEDNKRPPFQVYISSCSAHSKALSKYGRTKYFIEQKWNDQRHLVIKPGLVTGPGGLYERMVKTVRSSPVLPVFDGGNQPLQRIDREDLCRIIYDFTLQRKTGTHVIAESETMRMIDFQRSLLEERKVEIPLPSWPVLKVVQLFEKMGFELPITSENMLGLRGMVEWPITERKSGNYYL